MELLITLFIAGGFLALCVLYFLPLVIAHRRGHHQRVPIAALNILLGWTFLGWVIALIWSLSAVDPARSDRFTRAVDEGGA